MGSPSSRVDGSDRKFYVMAAERSPEGKEALKRFDAALNAQRPTNSSTGGNSSQSASVRTSQDQLTALGFDTGGSDGIAGPRTAAAVRAFQEANGLTVDGIIGPQTLRALEATTNKAAQPSGPPAPVDGSDRKFYIQASEKTGDPAILARFDQDLQTHNDFQTAQTPVDASDRKLYAQSDDPTAVEQFDRDLASYNRVKGNIADAYQHRVDLLVNEQGLEPAVAENLVAQQFQAQGLPRHALPANASTSQFDHPVDGSDRRLYMMASEQANDGEGDPTILERFDSDVRAYSQYKGIIGQAFEARVESIVAETGYSEAYARHLVTEQFLNADTPSHLLPDSARTFQFNNLVDGSDRRLYMMASEQANDGQGDPSILERFDEAHAAYNDHKDVLATSYENRVQILMQEHGYDRRLAEDMASLEFKSSLPNHLLPEAAQSWNFGTSLDGSDRRLNPEAFDRDLAAQNELQSVIGEAYSGHLQAATQQLMEEQGYNEELAKHLAGLSLGAQLRASGIPASFLPESMTFNAGQALVDNYSIFDNALDSKDGLDAEGEAWTFGRLWDAAYDLRNRHLGLDNDGKVGLADLETIRDNPNDFPPDVAAAAIVLRTAADHDDELRSFFDQPNFFERLKDSPWLDPNTDSFVVNVSRAVATGGLSLLTADEFRDRLIEEGPGTLEKVNNSLSQLDPINQGRLLITDRDQAFDNYRSFAGGAGDFFVDTAKLLGGAVAFANPALAGLLHEATGINVYAEATGMATGAVNAYVFDPDQLAQDIVGWDQFVEDPYRWAGNQAPDIVLEILGTKGASKAARAARVADAAADAGGAGRRVLSPSQDLIDGFSAEFIRSDILDGKTIHHLKFGDNHYQTITELADGSFHVRTRQAPPPPLRGDFVSDAPPPWADETASGPGALDQQNAGRLDSMREQGRAVVDRGRELADRISNEAGMVADYLASVLDGNPRFNISDAGSGRPIQGASNVASAATPPTPDGGLAGAGAATPPSGSSATSIPSSDVPLAPRNYPLPYEGAELRSFNAKEELAEIVKQNVKFLNSPQARAQGLQDFADIFDDLKNLDSVSLETLERFNDLVQDARLPDSRYARIENQLQNTRNAIETYIKSDVVTRDSLDLLRREGFGEIADFAERELTYLNGLKTEAVNQLDQLLGDGRFADMHKQLGKTKNAIIKHLGSDDLMGAIRDNHGLPVPDPTRPKTNYDHLEEVTNGIQSLENTRQALLDAINPSKFDNKDNFIRSDAKQFQRARDQGIPSQLSLALDLLDVIIARGETLRDFKPEP